MSHRPFLFVLALLLSAWSAAATAAEAPRVAASIAPLHALTAAVMAGAGEPALIVRSGASPHTYSLRPSDARTLNKAEVLVWTGPGLEMFLARPIAALAGRARVVTVVDSPAEDPHFWLSPVLAAAAADKIQSALSAADPARRDLYTANAQALKDRLAALHDQGRRTLAPLADRPFLVFHDAWGHFAEAFGLSVAGAVALNPERAAGAKQVSAIRRLIGESGARCLFREPQFESPLLETVLEGHDQMRVFVLDPLGSTHEPGADLYFSMMRDNIAAVADCLG